MKRRIALLTAICMILFSLPVFGAEFTDMPPEDSRYYDAFVYAINKKLITGDGTNLNPNSYITQAEALTIISRIKPFDCDETDITGFGVSKDKWYYSTVAKAYTLGYVTADTLSPEKSINRISANAIIGKVFGKTPTPWPNNELCTRAEFIWEIYFHAPDGKYPVTQTPDETTPTDSPSEETGEFSDLKAKAAQEAMQVALGVNPDGTSYINKVVYTDDSQTDWQSGRVSSSSRPSSGGSNSPSSGNDDDEPDEDETDAPTQEPTTDPDTPADEPTDAPTEPETSEPTYGEYDGPIDNDKDNVIDDPFDDGWRPPGWNGDDDEGQGGWDEEDDDFDINDADDPDYEPETDPTDEPTSSPSDEETDGPSESETDEPTDGETDEPTDGETDEPTDGETDDPTDSETDEPTDGETDDSTDSETDEPTDGETDEPTEEDSNTPSDEGDAVLPDEDDDGESEDNSSETPDDSTNEDDTSTPEE